MHPQPKTFRYLISIVFLTFHFVVYSQQNGGLFYHITKANGLSSNQATSVIQDREGYYWIATVDGLNRFNGTTCKVFRNIKNDSTSLSNNYCSSIKEDSNGDIWIGTLQGLNRFDKKKGKFVRYLFNVSGVSQDLTNSITGLETDGEGNIWVSSFGLWMYNIQSRKWISYSHLENSVSSIPKGNISQLQFDKKNKRLWMMNYQGCIFLDLKKNIFFHKNNNPDKMKLLDVFMAANPFVLDAKDNIWFYSKTDEQMGFFFIAKNEIEMFPFDLKSDFHNFKIDAENRVWINYWWSSTEIYDPVSKKVMKGFLASEHSRSALSSLASNLFIDRSGSYWICSIKGVSIYHPGAQAVRYHQLIDNEKSNFRLEFQISSIAEQGNGKLWIGTNRGLYFYDKEIRVQRKIDLSASGFNVVRCLTMVGDNILWIGGERSILLFDVKSEKVVKLILNISNVQFLTSDDEDLIQVGTWNDGLYVFSKKGLLISHLLPKENKNESIYHRSLFSFSKTRSDSGLWIGYNGGNGFSEIYFGNKSWQHYQINANQLFPGSSNTISVIREDENENVWLGTYGNGVFNFNKKKNSYTNYSQSDGLAGNFINSILSDYNGWLWVSSNNGINIIDKNAGTVRETDIDLAMPSQDFVANGFTTKDKHLLFFGGAKFVVVNPLHYLDDSLNVKLLINGFRIFEKEKSGEPMLYLNSSITLTPKENYFSIEYSLLKANPDKRVQYAYQLSGFDDEWIEVKDRRIAHYTNVPPGDYRFQVKATDEAGNWKYFSKPIRIFIKSYFYKTWWFISVMVFILIYLAYYFYQYRIKQIKKMLRLRNNISQDLHDEVASTLSGIRLYSELAKQQMNDRKEGLVKNSLDIIASNALEMKEKMSDIIWTVNPSNDSLGTLFKKLNSFAGELTKARNIQLTTNAGKEINVEKLNMQQRRNIYLICKEAINNAVKYSGAKNLEISFLKSDHLMNICIIDDGVGFDANVAFDGNGLLNMKARAKEIGGELIIETGFKKGTTIQLKMKL